LEPLAAGRISICDRYIDGSAPNNFSLKAFL